MADLWQGYVPQTYDANTQGMRDPTAAPASALASGLNAAARPAAAAPANGVATAANNTSAGVNPQGAQYSWGDMDPTKNRYNFNLDTNGWTNAGNMLYRYGYDANQDSNRIQVSGGNGQETNFNRVYGWMNYLAKANGLSDISQASPEMAARFMDVAVGRLKTDYMNTDASGASWQRSGFAGFDQRAAANRHDNVVPGVTPPAAPGTTGTPAPGTSSTTPPSTPPVASQPLPPGYQGQGGGSSQLTPAQKMALASDPNQAYRYMMNQIGYNPDAPGLLGNFLQKRFQPLLEARMAAGGLEGATVGADGQMQSNYMDSIDQLINGFGGAAMGKTGGGNFFGDMATIGNNAARNAAPVLGQLKDQSQAMQYLQQLGSLRYAGANPLIQQAGADVMQAGQNAYQDNAFNNELAGRNIDPFTQWLQSQSKYRGIYGV